MIKIAPSLLSSDFSRLGDEIVRMESAGADIIHIDVMDGHFVPNITIGPIVVKSIRKITKLPFDVHLMIENADNYIEDFINAGADIISVHVENNLHINRTLRKIRDGGARPAVALNPSTSLATLDWILEDVEMVLLMTVNPGFGGQSFIKSMVKKVEELRNITIQRGLTLDIEVDGGITPDNIFDISGAGANIIVAGSTVFNAPDAVSIIRELREKAYSGNA